MKEDNSMMCFNQTILFDEAILLSSFFQWSSSFHLTPFLWNQSIKALLFNAALLL